LRRFASASVLAPTAIAVAYIGGWLFLGLCALAAAVILWEWTSLVFRGTDPRIFIPGLTALLVATALTGEGQAGAAIAMIAIGALLAGGVVAAWPRRYLGSNPVLWGAGGVVYAGIALVAPVLLRADPQLGLVALLFLFAVVWATDIFAYLVGRLMGGPLLWPGVSPKKTWSGAMGGLGVAGGLALILSVVAQGGDLFESAVKRRFGAKDASSLIPGHGGLMDRLDGFIVAALVAVLIGSLHQGMATPARGLLIW
jgi:phosphatidate cytidylyltransferase